MSKPIFIADIHLNNYNNFAKPLENSDINDRTQAMFTTLEKAFDIGIKRNSPVVIAGDLFDERRQVDTRIMNRALTLIKNKTSEMPSGVPLLVLQGNHDNFSNTPDTESSIDILPLLSTKEHPILIFKTKVQQYTYQDIVYTFLPYTEAIEDLKEQLKAITKQPKDKDKTYILVGHVGVDGSDSGHYNHRLGGAFGLGDLFPDYFDFTFLGHYHLRQNLALNVVYVGSTIPLNFNDVDQTKGIYLYDSETKKATYKSIPNKGFTIVDTTKHKYTEEQLKELIKNNYVKFITSDKDLVTKLQHEDEVKDYINLEFKDTTEVTSRLGIDPMADVKTIVESYTKTYYPEATKEALNILAEVAI